MRRGACQVSSEGRKGDRGKDMKRKLTVLLFALCLSAYAQQFDCLKVT